MNNNSNSQGAMGGPVGAQQMMGAGTPNNAHPSQFDIKRKLNTYIYDYFLKNEMYDLARTLYEKGEIEPIEKPSPERKGVNGAHEGDSKDDIPGKPADLPRANVPGDAGSSFLLDWWSQFWDCWSAARTKSNSSTRQYLQHMQTRMASERQRMNPQVQNNMNARNTMMQNGINMNNMGDMKKLMMMQQAGRNPSNAQMNQMRQMTAHNQMQREGSQMDMNGQTRPQTPGSGDNAPSPKRQRVDGAGFNGQMGPMGRGQNPGMPSQQFNAMQMQANNHASKMAYANSLSAQMQSAMDSSGQKGMPNPNGLPQGSPAMDANGEAFNINNLRNLPAGAGLNMNSNGALQDYQMQLMLLEQQNKKRLLMARQEQDSHNGAGGPGQGQDLNNPQAMLTNGMMGPSPGPEDQMKRGTPKMAHSGMPQPGMDGMPQGRGSPAPGFDPNQMGSMAANFQGMKMPTAMMGPNGQMIPANPHAFAQMNGQFTPQHLELMRQQAANRQNGPWGQGQPQGVMHGGMPQQPPNMTPQQRNSNMPPPPAPATGEQNRTQPSSPQQSNPAPPTPSQNSKPSAKAKKESAKSSNKKAAANKKGGTTAATPASEAGDQPPTPTPAPAAAPQQFNKNGPAQGAQAGGAASNAPNGPAQQPDINANNFSATLDGADMDFGMGFAALDGTDVLDNFDFDSFLNNNDGDAGFAFDSNMAFDANGGLEAGTDI